MTTWSYDTAQPPGPPNSCTPAMAPSPLAWLLHLAAFFHLSPLLAGEWVRTLPGEEREDMLGCKLYLPGENRPSVSPSHPSGYWVGNRGDISEGSVEGTRCLGRRVKAGRNLSRLLADEQELVLPTEVNYNLYKPWHGARG